MSFTVASDGMAQRLAKSPPRPLRMRILSALVLLPAAVAAVVSGSPFFELLAIAAALAMSWEWSRICAQGRFGLDGWLFGAIIFLAVAAAGLLRFDLALVLIVTGAAAVYYAARAVEGGGAVWVAAGVPAVGLPVISLIWLEGGSAAGWHAVLWLFGAVWATDIGAYVFGRWIGGARLAPRISPSKTWAGLLAGVVCASLWSVSWGWWFGASSLLIAAVIGGFTAVLAQAGDLGMSVVKRHFGVKDASGLIPGHGGVLDRVDGLLATAPALAAAVLATRGGTAPWLGP